MPLSSSQTMAGRKQEVYSPNALRALLSAAIPSYESAEIALLHIMKAYSFDTYMLQQILNGFVHYLLIFFLTLIWVQITFSEDNISVSFSEVLYENIAPMVGLQSYYKMNDVKPFHLHRSRIPTALFKSIVQDIDVMQMQYGHPIAYDTEVARSQFLSPVSASYFSNHQ